MEEALLSLLPGAPVYHLGLYRFVLLTLNSTLSIYGLRLQSLTSRDPISLQAIEYYSRLPQSINVDRIFILDPMVATGNTALAALKMMQEWGLGMDKVCFLGIIGSRKALDGLEKKYPDVHVSQSPYNASGRGISLDESGLTREGNKGHKGNKDD